MKKLTISLVFAALFSGSAFALSDSNMVAGAPKEYTVVPGDSLWKISGQYLKHPWLWKELWEGNKGQIVNPHLIYPGQVLHFDPNTKKLSVSKGKSITGKGKLSPVPYEIERTDTVKAISWNVLKPLASQSLVIDEDRFENAPRVLALEKNYTMAGLGNEIYVTGIPNGDVKKWIILQQGQLLNHPVTGLPLGYEVTWVGVADLQKVGDLSTMKVTGSRQEIGRGDWLHPAPTPRMVEFVPEPAPKGLRGVVVSALQGSSEAARWSAVLLDIGSNHGVKDGHVFQVNQVINTRIRQEGDVPREYTLPERKVARVMVYRTQPNVSFAMIMESTGETAIGDSVVSPEED